MFYLICWAVWHSRLGDDMNQKEIENVQGHFPDSHIDIIESFCVWLFRVHSGCFRKRKENCSMYEVGIIAKQTKSKPEFTTKS